MLNSRQGDFQKFKIFIFFPCLLIKLLLNVEMTLIIIRQFLPLSDTNINQIRLD